MRPSSVAFGVAPERIRGVRFMYTMNHVVVTRGRLGRMVVDLHVSRGAYVESIDVTKRDDGPCSSPLADLTQAGEAFDEMSGTLSCILPPCRGVRLAYASFQVNVYSRCNVAEAAVSHGLSRIVFTSSVFTLGWQVPYQRIANQSANRLQIDEREVDLHVRGPCSNV